MPRHTHPERAQQRRHKRTKAAKAKPAERPRNEYVLRAIVQPPPTPRAMRVALTPAQAAILRDRGLRNPANAAAWLIRSVNAETDTREARYAARQRREAARPPHHRPRPKPNPTERIPA